MKQQISAPNTVPTANIAVNKSRLKVYKNAGEMPTYYLQKGQEFQIELANPTTDVVLAKVILNGKSISQGGLVLNPGQRVYLERYLDVAKKFLFDTYEVSGSEEMKAAIANNGDIRVEFYRERIAPIELDYTYRPHIYYNNAIGLGDYYNGTPSDFLRGTTTSSGLINGSLTNTSTSYSTQGIKGVNTGPTLDSLSIDSLNDTTLDLPNKLRSKSLKKQSIETGRVEEGGDSNQEFKYVNKTFEYTAFHTIEYKMLPVSQKINTVEDINVKVYCTNCGAKLGKTDNFCASCGKKK